MLCNLLPVYRNNTLSKKIYTSCTIAYLVTTLSHSGVNQLTFLLTFLRSLVVTVMPIILTLRDRMLVISFTVYVCFQNENGLQIQLFSAAVFSQVVPDSIMTKQSLLEVLRK